MSKICVNKKKQVKNLKKLKNKILFFHRIFILFSPDFKENMLLLLKLMKKCVKNNKFFRVHKMLTTYGIFCDIILTWYKFVGY